MFSAKQLIRFYPILKQNKGDFIQLFKLATGPKGPMGIASIEGARLISKLTKLVGK